MLSPPLYLRSSGWRAKNVVECPGPRPSTIALWHFMNASSSCERIMFSSLRGSPINAGPCELRASPFR